MKENSVGRPLKKIPDNIILDSHKVYCEKESVRIASQYIRDAYGIDISHSALLRRYKLLGYKVYKKVLQ